MGVCRQSVETIKFGSYAWLPNVWLKYTAGICSNPYMFPITKACSLVKTYVKVATKNMLRVHMRADEVSDCFQAQSVSTAPHILAVFHSPLKHLIIQMVQWE